LNFGIFERGLQHGESVNICLPVIAHPTPAATMRGIIAKDKLQARAERQLFGDLAPAPAGDFGNAIDITRQPAGAV
jgi:hypothetical protein